jgi:hypothetical protein
VLRTIIIANHISAQGDLVREHMDGRVTISTGTQLLTGRPVARQGNGQVILTHEAGEDRMGHSAQRPQASMPQS